MAGRMVGDPVRVVGADVLHPEHVGQQLGEFVGAGGHRLRAAGQRLVPVPAGHHRVLVPDRPRARAGRDHDRLAALEHLDVAADQGQRVAEVAGVHVHLAAAGLRGRELDLVAEPLEQPDRGPARLGEQRVGQAGHEQGDSHDVSLPPHWPRPGLTATGAHARAAGPARRADHEVRLEHDLAVPVGAVAERLLDQQLGRGPAQLVTGLADRGERHRGRGREVHIVVTHDRHAVGHPDPAGGHLLQHTQREQVVRAEHGRGPCRAGRPASAAPARCPAVTFSAGVSITSRSAAAAGPLQGTDRPVPAVADLADAHRAAHERDPLMTGLQQVGHGQVAAEHVVHGHRALAAGR